MIRKSYKLSGQYKVWIVVVVIASQWIIPIENARILAVETIGSYSCYNFMNAVLRSLMDAGHSVTAFTPFADDERENYTAVDTSGEIHRILELNVTYLLDNFSRPFALAGMLTGYRRSQCDNILGNRRLRELMASQREGGKADFDVIIVEPLEYDCVSHVANAMRLPIIYVISSPMISSMERTFTGHLSNPAIVPHMLGQQGVPKTFVQRFGNTVLLAYNLFVSTCQERIARFTDPKPFDLSPTINPSIIFQNTHYITETPNPVVPNLIHIGGIHMKPVKSIPQDILDFIDDSPQGIIFFSFGSIVKSSSLPVHIKKAFKEALAQVPQKILWKYEGEMEDKPKNVMIKKWFPQRDILLHPKIKLFIGHGGMSGVYEAMDAGVPVLGFPVFFDQPRNIDHLVHNEMAISMDLLTVTKDSLLNAISELVNNEKYAKNAKVASLRFKDRPISPQKLVVYWTEYVIRHGGAPHLRSFAHNLTWYQYFLLDIIGVIFIFIFIIVYITYTILKVIYTLTLKYSRNIKVKSQ